MPAVELNPGESLEIQQLSRLKRDWMPSLREGALIQVALSDVKRVDTAGLQFLLALRREALGRRVDLTLRAPSLELCARAEALGLKTELF